MLDIPRSDRLPDPPRLPPSRLVNNCFVGLGNENKSHFHLSSNETDISLDMFECTVLPNPWMLSYAGRVRWMWWYMTMTRSKWEKMCRGSRGLRPE